jgi:hypothetical protein
MDVEPPPYGVTGDLVMMPRRKREDVQKMKSGLFAALQELRSQNDDLTSRIDTLGKATSETAKNRAATESALIRTMQTAENVRIRRRLPQPPQLETSPPSPNSISERSPSSPSTAALQHLLAHALHERDTARAELCQKDKLLAAALREQLLPVGPVVDKEVKVRNEIKVLLEQRADELQAQLSQVEMENVALHRRVTENEEIKAEYQDALHAKESSVDIMVRASIQLVHTDISSGPHQHIF